VVGAGAEVELPDRRRWLAEAVVRQLVVLHPRHLDVNVDAVQQRAGACPERAEGMRFWYRLVTRMEQVHSSQAQPS